MKNAVLALRKKDSSLSALADAGRKPQRQRDTLVGLAPFALALMIAFPRFSQGAALINGTFDSGATGWTLIGGADVVATGQPDDNPFGRVPDGGLVFLYQIVSSPEPRFTISFDFFTDLMSPVFSSPGGFPDTAFATIYFGETESGLRPELFQSGASLALFDFDAVNKLSGLLVGATLTNSPARRGWTRFDGRFDAVGGQPFFAVTFQNLNGNGVLADSAFLVDNLMVGAVPEPTVVLLALVGSITGFAIGRTRRFERMPNRKDVPCLPGRDSKMP